MTMFSNKMLCRETSCRQSRVCSETRMPSRKTEGFCTGAEPRFQIVPKLFEDGVFRVCCRLLGRNFVGVSFRFLRRRQVAVRCLYLPPFSASFRFLRRKRVGLSGNRKKLFSLLFSAFFSALFKKLSSELASI